MTEQTEGVGAPTPSYDTGYNAILSKAEVAEIIRPALNSGTGDAEHEALVELADLVGLEFDGEGSGRWS